MTSEIDLTPVEASAYGLRTDWPWKKILIGGEEFGPEWAPYRLELVVTPYRDRYIHGDWQGFLPHRGWPVEDSPVVVFERGNVYYVCEYAVFRMELTDDRVPTASIRWAQAGPDREIVQTHKGQVSRRHLSLLRRGRPLIDYATVGRPFDSGKYDKRDKFWRQLAAGLRELEKSGTKPNYADLRETNKLKYKSRSSIYDNLKKRKVKWSWVKSGDWLREWDQQSGTTKQGGK